MLKKQLRLHPSLSYSKIDVNTERVAMKNTHEFGQTWIQYRWPK